MNMLYRSLLPSAKSYHFLAALFLCAFFGAYHFTLAATISVPAGGNLQAAINQAQPGDTIVLQAGASYTGGFYLPYKNGASYITIRTSTPDSNLPTGVRVTPNDAGKMAKIITPGSGLPAIRTEPYAHHYQLIGLEIMPASAGSVVYEVVSFGTSGPDQDDYSEVPHHLIVDRCFVHAWPNANFKRGIGLNSADTEIINSHVSDFHSDFQDSQAIGGFNGPGPFKIINNRLEGAAENIMFGGGVPSIYGLVPSNIEIRRNHLYKPWSWRPGSPGSTGYRPWIKNLFEIKNGQDILLDGNIMENNWYQADQHGTAIVLTPRTEGGAVPWAVAQRLTFTNNIIKNVGGGVSIVGRDNPPNYTASNNIVFRNNLFENIRNEYSVDGSRVIIVTGDNNVTFDHNTILHANYFIRGYGEQTSSFVFTNNIIHYGSGLWSDCGLNQNALNCYFPGNTFVKNALMGSSSAPFGNSNFYPSNEAAVNFVDYAGGNYRLSGSSPYKNAGTDGRDLGADIDAIIAAIYTQLPTPNPNPQPTPTPSPEPPPPPAAPIANGTYAIRVKHSGRVMDIWGASGANGTSIRQYVWHGGDNQKFVVEAVGNGYYKIIAKNSGKAVDVPGGSLENGVAMQQWQYYGNDNQLWEIEPVGNNFYKIISKQSGKALEIYGFAHGNGRAVIQWDYWGGDNQQWLFEPVQ